MKDGRLLNSTTKAEVRVFDDVKKLAHPQGQILPPELLEARVGEEVLMECSKPDAKETRWYRLHSAMKGLLVLAA
jgi:predicted pyridoxine 5'-phosphate oxidase superfamily flavin-nucleotide-binding protein